MNFFTLLKNDHKEVKETFQTLLDAKKIDRKATKELCHKLLLHMEMEESFFYPEMEKFKSDKDMSEEAFLEHDEGKRYIDTLLTDTKLSDMEYTVKLEMLKLCILHHAEEEEKELFPEAKEKLSEEQIKQITADMMALKEKKHRVASK